MIETVYGAPTRAENHYPERVTTVSDEFLKDVAGSLSTRDECSRAINIIVGRMAIIATDELRLQSLGDGPLPPDAMLTMRPAFSANRLFRPQVGEVSTVPVQEQRIMRATWSLMERYFASPEHKNWTHAELDAEVQRIATEYQVTAWVVLAMFGKIVQCR